MTTPVEIIYINTSQDIETHLGLKLGKFIISYDIDINKKYYYENKELFLIKNIIDFKISIYKLSNSKFKKKTLLDLINKLQDECINNYTYIPVNYSITKNINFVKVVYKKYFSNSLPYIPIILIKKSLVFAPNETIIMLKNKILGILINNEIIPMIIMTLIIKNYIINDYEMYIVPYIINYKIAETSVKEDNSNNDEENYILIPNDKYKLSNNQYFNKNDYIYEIDDYKFNKMGFIYLKEINSSIHINTYMLLKGSKSIKIKYTPAIFINSHLLNSSGNNLQLMQIKTNTLIIDKFNSNKLKLPIQIQPNYNYKDKTFTILSEDLIRNSNLKSPISLENFTNSYSNNNFIVMINNNKIYIVNKISGKNINNINIFNTILDKVLSKNKRKFELVNDTIDELLHMYI